MRLQGESGKKCMKPTVLDGDSSDSCEEGPSSKFGVLSSPSKEDRVMFSNLSQVVEGSNTRSEEYIAKDKTPDGTELLKVSSTNVSCFGEVETVLERKVTIPVECAKNAECSIDDGGTVGAYDPSGHTSDFTVAPGMDRTRDKKIMNTFSHASEDITEGEDVFKESIVNVKEGDELVRCNVDTKERTEMEVKEIVHEAERGVQGKDPVFESESTFKTDDHRIQMSLQHGEGKVVGKVHVEREMKRGPIGDWSISSCDEADQDVMEENSEVAARESVEKQVLKELEVQEGDKQVFMEQEVQKTDKQVFIEQEVQEGDKQVFIEQEIQEGDKQVFMEQEVQEGDKQVFMEQEVQEGDKQVFIEQEVQKTDQQVFMEQEVQKTDKQVFIEQEVQKTDQQVFMEQEVQETDQQVFMEQEVQKTDQHVFMEQEVQKTDQQVFMEQEVQETDKQVFMEQEVQETDQQVFMEQEVQETDQQVFMEQEVQETDKQVFMEQEKLQPSQKEEKEKVTFKKGLRRLGRKKELEKSSVGMDRQKLVNILQQMLEKKEKEEKLKQQQQQVKQEKSDKAENQISNQGDYYQQDYYSEEYYEGAVYDYESGQYYYPEQGYYLGEDGQYHAWQPEQGYGEQGENSAADQGQDKSQLYKEGLKEGRNFDQHDKGQFGSSQTQQNIECDEKSAGQVYTDSSQPYPTGSEENRDADQNQQYSGSRQQYREQHQAYVDPNESDQYYVDPNDPNRQYADPNDPNRQYVDPNDPNQAYAYQQYDGWEEGQYYQQTGYEGYGEEQSDYMEKQDQSYYKGYNTDGLPATSSRTQEQPAISSQHDSASSVSHSSSETFPQETISSASTQQVNPVAAASLHQSSSTMSLTQSTVTTGGQLPGTSQPFIDSNHSSSRCDLSSSARPSQSHSEQPPELHPHASEETRDSRPSRKTLLSTPIGVPPAPTREDSLEHKQYPPNHHQTLPPAFQAPPPPHLQQAPPLPHQAPPLHEAPPPTHQAQPHGQQGAAPSYHQRPPPNHLSLLSDQRAPPPSFSPNPPMQTVRSSPPVVPPQDYSPSLQHHSPIDTRPVEAPLKPLFPTSATGPLEMRQHRAEPDHHHSSHPPHGDLRQNISPMSSQGYSPGQQHHAPPPPPYSQPPPTHQPPPSHQPPPTHQPPPPASLGYSYHSSASAGTDDRTGSSPSEESQERNWRPSSSESDWKVQGDRKHYDDRKYHYQSQDDSRWPGDGRRDSGKRYRYNWRSDDIDGHRDNIYFSRNDYQGRKERFSGSSGSKRTIPEVPPKDPRANVGESRSERSNSPAHYTKSSKYKTAVNYVEKRNSMLRMTPKESVKDRGPTLIQPHAEEPLPSQKKKASDTSLSNKHSSASKSEDPGSKKLLSKFKIPKHRSSTDSARVSGSGLSKSDTKSQTQNSQEVKPGDAKQGDKKRIAKEDNDGKQLKQVPRETKSDIKKVNDEESLQQKTAQLVAGVEKQEMEEKTGDGQHRTIGKLALARSPSPRGPLTVSITKLSIAAVKAGTTKAAGDIKLVAPSDIGGVDAIVTSTGVVTQSTSTESSSVVTSSNTSAVTSTSTVNSNTTMSGNPASVKAKISASTTSTSKTSGGTNKKSKEVSKVKKRVTKKPIVPASETSSTGKSASNTNKVGTANVKAGASGGKSDVGTLKDKKKVPVTKGPNPDWTALLQRLDPTLVQALAATVQQTLKVSFLVVVVVMVVVVMVVVRLLLFLLFTCYIELLQFSTET